MFFFFFLEKQTHTQERGQMAQTDVVLCFLLETHVCFAQMLI